MKKFKVTLEELYTRTDALALEVLKTTGKKKEFLIGDIIEISKELVHNNCRNFIKKNGADELNADDLYISATSISLYQALETFKPEREIHFLKYWQIFMERQFLYEFEKATSIKAKYYQKNVCSSDVEIDSTGNTILSYASTGQDIAEDTCMKIVVGKLISEFEEKDKHGKLIRCEMLGTPAVRRMAILKVLGAEEYGAKERKIVQRTKERFKKFLLENGAEKLLA